MNNQREKVLIMPGSSSGSTPKPTETAGNTQVNLDNLTDFSKVCRTCATITELVIPIFSGEGLQNNLADKIHKHLPIRVSPDDVLPQVVCYQCASTLLACHELVKCSIQADRALRSRIDVEPRTDAVKQEQTSAPRTSNAAIEEETETKLQRNGDYVPQIAPLPQIAPPEYSPPTFRCQFCHTNYPDPAFKEHVIAHSESFFVCEECIPNKLVARKVFMPHMLNHANQYSLEGKDLKKVIKKRKEKDVNQNINEPESITTQPELPITQDPKPMRNIEENDFSDHSDGDGFGPLPESVFEAIEDSQESQPCEDNRRISEIDTNNDESNHSGIPTKDYSSTTLRKRARTCPICAKVYTASSSYFYHMKYTHKRIKEHECQTCAKKFATRAMLKIHETTHTGERQFECKECKKQFRSNASLYIHEQTHLGVKSWTCDQCQQSFRWKTHLLRHMKRHSADKGHVCSTCGRGFSVRCDLLRHERTHTAGSFACDKCDVKFAQKRYLKVHMTKQHPAKASKSD